MEEEGYIERMVDAAAGKLLAEYMTAEAFDIVKAKNILARCVGANVLINVLNDHTDKVISRMRHFEMLNNL